MSKITLKNSIPFLALFFISLASIFVPTLANFDDGKV